MVNDTINALAVYSVTACTLGVIAYYLYWERK
jgi:hypothetical protein